MISAETTEELPSSLSSGLAEAQLPMIDGLRAIAVFLVIFYHFGFEFVPGGLGVLIFFVISGFLITWLLLKENSKRGAVSLKRFYARRSLRIFPAFYAYSIFVIAMLTLFGKRLIWPQTVAALLYVNNYYQAIHGDPGTAFSHTWSLGVEEQFYLLWPVLFLLLRTNTARLIRVPALLILAIWIYRAILQFVFAVYQGWFYEAFDTRFDHLLIGCLLAILLFTKRHSRLWRVLCANPWQIAVSVALLAASSALEYKYGTDYRDFAGFIANPLLAAILIPQLIVHRNVFVFSWLQAAPVRYLGRISYSLYLYQQMIMDPVAKILKRFPMAVQLFGCVAVVVMTATISFFLIEKPFLRLKDRYFHS